MGWAAGYIDVCGWLVLAHVYTAHMTGNTVSLGVDMAQGDWTQALHHGWPILAFLGGLLFSAMTAGVARRREVRSSFAIALGTEVVLLAVFIYAGTQLRIAENPKEVSTGALLFLIAVLAASLGMQTVTVTRINGLRVYTTYLTGSLSKFAEAVTDYVLWFHDRTHGRFGRRIGKVLRVTPRQRCAQHAALTGGLWIFYFAGAVCGASMEHRYALMALLAPLVVLVCATFIDLKWPVMAADEPRNKIRLPKDND